jgi:hypothetical protein
MRSEKKMSFYFALTSNRNVEISHEHYEFRWVPFTDALCMLHYEQLKLIWLKVIEKDYTKGN